MRFIIGNIVSGRFFGIDTNSKGSIYPFVLGMSSRTAWILGIGLIIIGIVCLWYGFALINVLRGKI